MPSIPRFQVRQDSDFIYVEINVPYVRVSDMEFYIDDCDFTFWCKPYLLKLTFPYPCVDDDRGKAVYDVAKNNGTVTVSLSKEKPGQHFENLDMLTKLLQPKKWKPEDDGLPSSVEYNQSISKPNESISNHNQSISKNATAPLIEVLSSFDNGGSTIDNEMLSSIEAVDQSSLEKNPSCSQEKVKSNSSLLELEKTIQLDEENEFELKIEKDEFKYGFHNQFEHFFKAHQTDILEIVELEDPDNTSRQDRKLQRYFTEQNQFDSNRYLSDLYESDDDPILQESIAYTPHWQIPLVSASISAVPSTTKNPLVELKTEKIIEQLEECKIKENNSTSSFSSLSISSSSSKVDSVLNFNQEERDLLCRLPNKEYLITPKSEEEKQLMYGLMDILCAYAYDHRFTQGDRTVESAWTLSILSPLLSWLDSPKNVLEVLKGFSRRSLIYPYIRLFSFTELCMKDCLVILKQGRRTILRCLLHVYQVFEHSETKYLLNPLYIQDYCVWIQSVQEESIEFLVQELEIELKQFCKDNLELGLLELEKQNSFIDDDEDDDSDDATEKDTSNNLIPLIQVIEE